jgi:hypothetical protein
MLATAARRAVAAACVLALCVGLAACGSSGGSVPRGNPDDRHGPAAVDSYASVELLRALLIASSDSYYAGGSSSDAHTQLARARAAYDVLAGRVKAKDAVVDREVVARFNVLDRDLRHGITPDHYRDLAGPLSDQLMDGVAQALVPPAARSDRGLQAEALRRVALRLAATYDASATDATNTNGRLAFQESWGLWRRALALTALIKPSLGGQKDTVAGTLNGLRGSAFPNGPTELDAPPASKVDNASQKVVDALAKRYGLEPV